MIGSTRRLLDRVCVFFYSRCQFQRNSSDMNDKMISENYRLLQFTYRTNAWNCSSGCTYESQHSQQSGQEQTGCQRFSFFNAVRLLNVRWHVCWCVCVSAETKLRSNDVRLCPTTSFIVVRTERICIVWMCFLPWSHFQTVCCVQVCAAGVLLTHPIHHKSWLFFF